jgi:hypothetical protein
MSLRWMWISKLLAETGTGRPVKRAWRHWPHFALRASFPLGIRFTLLQCGQTNVPDIFAHDSLSQKLTLNA